MNKKQILAELEAWQATQKAMIAQLDALYDLVGCQTENPLPEAAYTLMDAHTDTVARLVGDETGCMQWWVQECHYGDRPLGAAKGDGNLRVIKTLKQLSALIAE